MWNDFYVKKIMAINSEGLGDLSHYKDQQGLLQQYHKISKGVPEGRLKYWSRFGDYFVNKINENDIIIALSGVATCIGYGVVNSKNVYNASFKPYDNYRDISWEKIESWDISGYGVNVQLGLLEISNKNKYSKFLEEFMAKYIDENGEDGCRTEGNIPETKYELNTILYGPPGTGKTYSVIEKALKITETRYDDREDALEKFKVLQEKGQIEFVTFHQSYSYEEFVEGIKPIPPNIDENPSDNVIYKVKAGVFKKAAELALDNIKYSDSIASNKFMGFSLTDEQMQNDFHKISLGDSTSDEGVRIHEYCIANGLIVMGWGGDIDYSDCDTLSEVKKKYDEEVQKNNYEYSKSNYEFIDRFKNKIKTGDIVFASKGLRTIRAIGVVDGDYQYLPNEEINRCHFRRVKWLLADVEIPISQIYSKQLSQQTTYSLNKSNFIEDFPRNLAENKSPNVVLIIDEINRGNISKIFGELITLIEDSKRIGADDELTVTLPYSGDSFGVPRNLYIIGTMNTADRSIALMDTALRRRFIFEEMMPKYDKLRFKVIDIEIDKMLESINKRITYLYDRDHQIGHAYFIKLKDILDEDHRYSELCSIFANKIIPLLQEYFYDDWSKIQIVLGCHPNQLKPTKNDLKNIDFDDTLNQLVQSKLVEEDKIIGFDHDDLDDSFEYQINPALIETGDKLINPDAFRNIYQLKSLKKDKHETPGS
ncbi:MAG: ATP/GTP-binding protein [Denitrovibrio sp.]|nr:MAG: ATP/GTP-binding protein [Denitrovibrio sp.]